ncbi:O-antigen ligase [Paraburkholderia sp. GAS334]
MTASRINTVVVAVLLFLAPATILTFRGGAGYCFVLLMLIGIGKLVAARGNREYTAPLRQYPFYVWSMVAFAIALPLQQIVEHYYFPQQFDAMSRFILSLPIFLLLCTVSTSSLAMVGWGCAAGALGVGGWALISGMDASWSDLHRLGNSFTNPIPFGNTALLLGFLSVLSIRWDMSYRRIAIVVKAVALIAGCYASYLSGTRGGWLALPLLVWLTAANFGWTRRRMRLLAIFSVLVVCAAGLLSTQVVRQRLTDTSSDFAKLEQGDADSSIGQRLQLWRASTELFEKNPIFGVGKGHLKRSLKSLADAGQASQVIVNDRAHSEFFSTIAELGVVGVVCLLLVYFGPMLYFLRNCKSTDSTVSTAAYCGLAITGSVIIFGFSIDVFSLVMNVSLVALLWATMMAIIYRGTCVERSQAPQSAEIVAGR